jgi:hypothetical protein
VNAWMTGQRLMSLASIPSRDGCVTGVETAGPNVLGLERVDLPPARRNVSSRDAEAKRSREERLINDLEVCRDYVHTNIHGSRAPE